MNKLWKDLLEPQNLKRGWHLARADLDKDFAEELYSADAIACDLELVIKEISKELATDTYIPHPLFQVEVPKTTLSIRPGTVMNISDRIVLGAVVNLIAPTIDKIFPEAVYSYRLKEPLPKQGAIFQETTIVDMPYLKKATIHSKIDPFESWYDAWPKFDENSRKTFGPDGYRFMATSDIAAYFENIQLPILRDQLLTHFPNDPKIINLLLSFLETWARKAETGRPHLRGIPQGNSIASFLGNLFLLPLDREFANFEKEHDARYQRYMDDVRVFTKTMSSARIAIFKMDHILRSLHLNVQSAKTKILDEKEKEITLSLIDPRIDEINGLMERTKPLLKKGKLLKKERDPYLTKIEEIACENAPEGRQKILRARRPLSGLDLRLFLRWINAHNNIESHKYVSRLLSEIQVNPDYRLTRKLVRATRCFPQKHLIETEVMKFLSSEANIFPHQEAECIRALRYISRIRPETVQYCMGKAKDDNAFAYVRMQAAYLLSRIELDNSQIKDLLNVFEKEKDVAVRVSIAGCLVQRRSKNEEIVRLITLHPNNKISSVGKMFRMVRNEKKQAKERLNHIFRDNCHWIICDNMPFLHLMSMSLNQEILQELLKILKAHRRKCRIRGLHATLDAIYKRTKESLQQIKLAAVTL